MNKVLATSALAFMAVVSANAVIINGSFENGLANIGNFTTLNPGNNTAITGWTVANGSIDYIGAYWQAAQGSRSLDLNALSVGSIYQEIATNIGQTYQITFAMSGNPDPGNANAGSLFQLRFQAFNASNLSEIQNQIFSYQDAAHTRTNMLWQDRTVTFTATEATTRIMFSGYMPTGAYGAALDNVRFEAVPEPFTMALMGGAALGAFAKVRKRRRLA